MLADRLRPFIVMEMLSRADDLARQGHDIISLGAGEPEFPVHPNLITAVNGAMDSGRVAYTATAGRVELRRGIAERYTCLGDEEWRRVIVTQGSSGALDLVLRLLTEPGDEILLKTPGYPCNPNLVNMANGVPRMIHVDASTNYHLTPGLIESNWNDRVRAVIVTSPCNPTGAVIDKHVMREIVRTVESLGGVLISDEIYHGLEYGSQSICALEYSDRVFVINSFSKYFGMTGWRIGWLISPSEHVGALTVMAQNQSISVNTLSQQAALAAIEADILPVYEKRRARLDRRRRFLVESLRDLQFSIPSDPQGAFYVYADAGRFSNDSYRFACDILEQVHVVVIPGQDFGERPGDCYLRFSYTARMEDLEKAIGRLRSFLANYKSGR